MCDMENKPIIVRKITVVRARVKS